MDRKANNYIIIIMVLLLVVVIIIGAGLCYLSWSEDRPSADSDRQEVTSSEQMDEALEQAREEGRQEILDGIRENLEANVSAEDIVSGLVQEEDGQHAETGTETAAETTEEGLKANPVSMEQISITDNGEYEYIQSGQVASKKGIDVSKYQKKINWSKVAGDGVEYAFLRVGCRGYGAGGTLIEDEYFHQNAKGALAQGIDIGAYFFSQAVTVEEAKEEAELVVNALKDYEVTYPVAIDIERVENAKARQDALSKEERTEICLAFCAYIEEAGYTPMIYGDLETFSKLLDPEQLSEYDFWICETDGKMEFPYEFAIWQYSHKGKVSGISTDTNMSISLKEW